MSDTHTATHAAGSRGRTPASRLARLRISSLGAVIMLIIEFILGIVYNLYGTAPTADKSIGLFSSPVLALHVILAILLVIAALGQLIRAIGTRHRLAIWMSAVGLLGILGPASPASASPAKARPERPSACRWRSRCRWRATSSWSSPWLPRRPRPLREVVGGRRPARARMA